MILHRARRAGTVAITGGCAAVGGAFWASDGVLLVASAAMAILVWPAWELGRGMHTDRDHWREAGGMIAVAGLALASGGFLAASWATFVARPHLVLASLSSAVSGGLYVVLPVGMALIGSRALRWRELSATGRSLPLAMGVVGLIAIPATVLLGLPGFVPGRLATLLGIVREFVLVGWVPLGVALRRAQPVDER